MDLLFLEGAFEAAGIRDPESERFLRLFDELLFVGLAEGACDADAAVFIYADGAGGFLFLAEAVDLPRCDVERYGLLCFFDEFFFHFDHLDY